MGKFSRALKNCFFLPKNLRFTPWGVHSHPLTPRDAPISFPRALLTSCESAGVFFLTVPPSKSRVLKTAQETE